MVAASRPLRPAPTPRVLERTAFDMSRAAEYFSVAELQTLTGQPRQRFVSVVIKELMDNALDACETAGVAPLVRVSWVPDPATGLAQLTVADNGAGIPREIVHRVFNFATRTSDKAVYRSPTRGAQGNALKTVLGIPWALGVQGPLVIEAQGRIHRITPHVDPAGHVHIEHQDTATARQPGTRVALCLPHAARDATLTYWGRAFAVFNPHLSVQISEEAPPELACLPPQDGTGDLYQSTVAFPGKGWRKYLPTDLTSAWWYSLDDLTRLIFSHIALSKQPRGTDLLLRDFVMQFRNLARNPKAQAVCAALPGISHLSDFAGHEAAVAVLYQQMHALGKAPLAEVLGAVGEAHFRCCFERWYGVERFWYQTRQGLHEGVPCVVEVAIAETEDGGDLWTGINFSPTFETPGANTWLLFDKFEAHSLTGALAELGTLPQQEGSAQVAVAVHLVCPTLEFLDKGKTRLKVPNWMAELLAKALWGAGKTLYQEAEQRKKDAAKADRQAEARERAAVRQMSATSVKEAVFAVLHDAWRHATGDGQYRVSSRFLFYPVRKLIQELTVKALDYDYFSQDLVVEYQRQGGQLPGLYYDPRGVLYEPHTGRAVPLGTQEVEAYVFPAWLYDKILYVEKKGVWPILQTAQLAERYDMAVIAGEGYATEAIRVLFQAASTGRQYQLFVLHDADPDGYNIARTLREETARMPGYAVDVIDLGLRWEDAMALGLDTKEFTRRREVSKELQPLLTEEERRAFGGRPQYRHYGAKPTAWICERVELNAFSAPQLVTYIEDRLQETGVRSKIVPPDLQLMDAARELYRAGVASRVQRAIEALLSIDQITDRLQDHFTADAPLDQARAWVEQAFTTDRAQWWRDAVRRTIEGLLGDQGEAITDAVRGALIEAIQDGALTDPEA